MSGRELLDGEWTAAECTSSAFLACLLLFAALTMSPAADTASRTDWSGTVRLSDPYVVQEGEHLVLEPDTRVIADVDPGTSEGLPSLIVKGQLSSKGTEASPVFIRVPLLMDDTRGVASLRDTVLHPSAGDSGCAFNLTAGHAVVHASIVQGAQAGLCASGSQSSMLVNGTQVRGNQVGISINENAIAQITATRFEDNRFGLDILLEPAQDGGLPDGRVTSEGNTFVGHTDPDSEASADGYFPRSDSAALRVRALEPVGFNPTLQERFETWRSWNWSLYSTNDTFEENTLAVYIGPGVAGIGFHHASFVDNAVGIRNAAEPDGPEARLNAHIYRSTFDNTARDIYSEGEHRDLFWTQSELRSTCLLEESRPPNSVCQAAGVGPFIEDLGLLAAIVALVLGVIAWFTEAGAYAIVRFLPVGRFHTLLSKEELLDHEARQEIVELVRTRPGLHLREVSREIGGYGRTVYHLQCLEAAGILKSERDGRYRRFYPLGLVDPEAAEISTRDQVLAVVRDRPGTYAAAVARELGVSRQVVYYHVKALVDAGLIVAEKNGRRKELFAAQ